jgi:hypothetical protein
MIYPDQIGHRTGGGCTTLCEFQTQELLPREDASANILHLFVMYFAIEARLNKAPLKEELMAGWLERLIAAGQ